jgi:hypothetical protein
VAKGRLRGYILYAGQQRRLIASREAAQHCSAFSQRLDSGRKRACGLEQFKIHDVGGALLL